MQEIQMGHLHSFSKMTHIKKEKGYLQFGVTSMHCNNNSDDDEDEWSTMVLWTKPKHLDLGHNKASKDLGAWY